MYNPLARFGLKRYLSAYRKQMKCLKYINDFKMQIIKDRRKELEEDEEADIGENIFLGHFLKAKLDGKFLTDEKILFEMNGMTLAHHDTLKSAISFVHYCLAKYPEMQQKVYEEVTQLGDEIKESDLDEMEFTHAFIKEVLRLFPAGSFFVRKLSSEITAGDFTFPKDVEVIISPFLMGRNPKYFSDPLKFDPNRFLELKSDPPGFISFSLAPRKCLGIKIAYIVMKIAIVKVLKNYKLSLPKESEELEFNLDMTLSAKEGINLNFESRNS
jgi:cytochrome P450 family 4